MIHANTTIGAVTLRVADLEKLVDFYQSVIGLTVLEQIEGEAVLGIDGVGLVRLVGLENGRSLPRATGLFHLALLLPTRDDLALWLKQYAAQDAPHWQGAGDHTVSEALYLSDPEGNGIEIYADRPRKGWTYDDAGTIKMGTDAVDLQELISSAPIRQWQGLPSGTTMGHVHLRVGEIDTTRRFYVDLLGFNLQMEMGGSALFMSAGGYHHHIGANVWQSRGAPQLPLDGYGLAGFTIIVPEGVGEIIGRLNQAHHQYKKTDVGYETYDPQGIKVILTVDF